MEKFCTWVKRRRKERGLTQKQLGNLAGLSQFAFEAWEQAVRLPRAYALRAVLRALDVPYEQFYREVDTREWFEPDR